MDERNPYAAPILDSETPSPDSPSLNAAPQRQLTLFDSTSIIVGIIIGSGVYKAAPDIAGCVPSSVAVIGVWLVGGLFALIGSLCYAELATMFPAEGGDYVFLSRAYGRPMGLLFAWCELWIVRPGSIGSLAFVFADYANEILPLGPHALVIYAAGAIAVLTAINILGVASGKWTQNLLTAAKLAGLLAVVAIGFLYSAPEASSPAKPSSSDWGLAMILILYAYGGWNDMAYVSAEVRNPEKNIFRALISGTLAVTLIYVLVNAAFLHALGFEGLRQAPAVAADVARLGAGDWGAKAVSVLVAVSALGAVNGMIFTGGRIYYAMGKEHALFALLGRWSPRLGTPAWSLAVQGLIAIGVVLGFGLTLDSSGDGGFERMVTFTLPVFWLFLLLVSLSLIVLRLRDPSRPRPHRAPFYPLTPLAFAGCCAFMLRASLLYAEEKGSPEPRWSFGLLAAGIVVSAVDYFLSRRDRRPG
ncbi:MAG TPA: amino acid permease [Pirellulales bacterium]|nr:amino acid permease [Pirellulales bacterium]